jgi:hypothetical protein
LGSQWSPFFSATFLTEAHAVRWARSSSSYWSWALSSVFSYVRSTLSGERSIVLGMFSLFDGMVVLLSPFTNRTTRRRH